MLTTKDSHYENAGQVKEYVYKLTFDQFKNFSILYLDGGKTCNRITFSNSFQLNN